MKNGFKFLLAALVVVLFSTLAMASSSSQSPFSLLGQSLTWTGTNNFTGALRKSGNNVVAISEFALTNSSSNGSLTLPNGLIMKWGSKLGATGGISQSTTFTTPFPTGIIFGLSNIADRASYVNLASSDATKATVTAASSCTAGVPCDIYWLVLGY